MMHRTSIIILFALLVCSTGFGQSTFMGLTPGKSTKEDVERVLGQPVKKFSETLIEYPPQPPAEQVRVQYRRNSAVVERIEPIYPDTLTRATVLRSLNLPPQPTASQTNSKGLLEEYFSTASVVLTYADADAGSGVSHVGYYSRELFESAAAKVPRGPAAANNNPNNQQPSQPSLPKFEDVIASARGALHSPSPSSRLNTSKRSFGAASISSTL